MFIDSHAHLNDEKLIYNLEEIINSANSVNVRHIICPAYDYQSSIDALKICNKYGNVFCTLGIHPHDAKSFDKNFEDWLSKNVSDKSVKAIGEIGLDYHYDLSPREVQREVFGRQIELADAFNLPIVVHTREAIADTLNILEKYKNQLRNGVLIHCFNASLEVAKQVVERGYYVSFGGAVTFKNATNLTKVVEFIPLNRIMLETDSPYMTPEPYRREINQPKNIPIIAEKIAQIKGIDITEVEKITSENVINFFRLGEL